MVSKVIIFISATIQTAFLIESPIVELPNGKIRGREATTSENKSYYAFESIPYAEPPIKNLRFKPPVPKKNWDGILNTTTLYIACYHQQPHGSVLSEDCLLLNVYTPKPRTRDDGLSVMVFIHGGGFMVGDTYSLYPDLYINNDVILVTLNYRLGIFGFLSTEDEIQPGNNGLKDQLLALRWVHDNIKLFGGDPDKVTIFGQSTGAASCAYHMLNQNSLGLFKRVILQSGTCLNSVAFQRNARKVAFGIGAIINSTFETNNDSQALLDFFQNQDPLVLILAADDYYDSISHSWDSVAGQRSLWAPVLEVKNPSAFITKKMFGLLKAGNFLPVSVMMGFNSEECIQRIADEDSLRSILKVLDEHLDYLVPDSMLISDSENRTRMGTKIKGIYTDGNLIGDLTSAVKYCSDNRVTRPMIKHAELLSKVVPTYFYQFSYHGTIGGSDVVYPGLGSVGHSEDVKYLFCSTSSCNNSNLPEADLLTRQRLIKIWTNFAKFGNPTPEPLEIFQNLTWPRVSTENGHFLYLDIGENLEIKNHPRQESYEKWTELYDSLIFDDFDTY